MSTLTKPKAAARKAVKKPVVKRRRSGPLLIPPTSPMYGHETAIGCVSIDIPQSATARRALIQARIHADNHS